MNYHYYIADVFTRELFNGAQIAVFPHADGLSDHTMALIAREFNLSETVFIFHRADGGDRIRRMRVFSPLGEVDFAGHPIIAAAFVLANCGDIALTGPVTPVIFEQNSGPIEVNISGEGNIPELIQFTCQVQPIVDRFTPSDEEISAMLGLNPAALDHKKYAPRLVSCGFPYLIVPVWNYESVRSARFNYDIWSRSAAPQTAAHEILLFAPKTPFADADFNLRLLGPDIGLHEDPPVGSAVPAFCAYLCSFEHTQKGTHVFSVDRGDAHSRRSVLNLEMDHHNEKSLTVRVGGQAVLFAQGSIELAC